MPFLVVVGALIAAQVSAQSLFESRFATGQVPFPFEDLRASFGPDSDLSTVIPDTRSLPKEHVSFKFPRVLSVVNLNPQNGQQVQNDPRNIMFLGYSEDGKQIEAISWNAALNNGEGGYDFQVVENYAPGQKPVIRTLPREACTVCHQGGTPIFTNSPWSETPGFPAGQRDGKPVTTSPELVDKLLKEHPSGKYAGVSIVPRSFEVVNINGSVRSANDFVQARRYCREACGTNEECRKNILLYSLIVSEVRQLDYPYTLKRAIERDTQRNWPADDFGFPSALIPNRDPTKPREQGSIGYRTYAKPGQFANQTDKPIDVTFDDNLSSSTDTGAFEKVPLKESESAVADPKTPRPIANRLKKGSFDFSRNLPFCLDFTTAQRARIMEALPLYANIDQWTIRYNDNWKLVDQALQSACVKKISTATWPPQPEAVTNAVIAYLQSSRANSRTPCAQFDQFFAPQARERGDCVDCVKPPETNPAQQVTKMEIVKVTEKLTDTKQPAILAKFQTYCAACHAKEARVATPLPLDDWDALKKWNADGSGDTPLQLMKDGIMPPKIAPRSTRSFPSPAEIDQMIKELAR